MSLTAPSPPIQGFVSAIAHATLRAAFIARRTGSESFDPDNVGNIADEGTGHRG